MVILLLLLKKNILKVQQNLAKKGLYVEITTAATFAAFFKYYKDNKNLGKVVLPLCGAGLKSS